MKNLVESFMEFVQSMMVTQDPEAYGIYNSNPEANPLLRHQDRHRVRRKRLRRRAPPSPSSVKHRQAPR